MTATTEVPEGTICTTAWCRHRGTARCSAVGDHVGYEEGFDLGGYAGWVGVSAAVDDPEQRAAISLEVAVKPYRDVRSLTAEEAEQVAAMVLRAVARLREIEATS